MGTKDLTEKTLENYNDVFADIFNVIVFEGEQRIQPMALQQNMVRSQYRSADDRLHEMERDISKVWKEQDVALSIYGIENQTRIEKYMSLRVMGYDGASYREQLLSKSKPLPVVTLFIFWHRQGMGCANKIKGSTGYSKGAGKICERLSDPRSQCGLAYG